MEIDVGYPDITAERQMLIETTGVQQSEAHAAMTAEELMQVQKLVRRGPVGERVVETILALVRNGWTGPRGLAAGRSQCAWGRVPGASQALSRVVRHGVRERDEWGQR